MILPFRLNQLRIVPLAMTLLIAISSPLRAAEPENQKKQPREPRGETFREVEYPTQPQPQAKSSEPDAGVMRKNLEAMQQAIKHRDEQIAQLAKQLTEQQHKPNLPPLENAQVKVYSLSFAPVQ